MNDFDPQSFIEETVAKLKETAKLNTVLVAVSGGVDSATTAVILKKAEIPTKCIFIDTGFMRLDEPEKALHILKQNNIDVEIISAQEEFFSALKNISDPREKRLVFKDVYFQIIEKYLRDNNISFIAQGSQSKEDVSKRIYHNVCNNEYINSNVHKIEPLLALTKSEIRQLAKAFHLTPELAERLPFPGPGLLIRFGGEYTPEKLNLIRKATEIVDTFKNKYSSELFGCFQIFPYLCDGSFVTFINHKNETDLGSIFIIRAVTLQEGIYKPFILSGNLFQELTDTLMQIDGIARVCLDMTPKNGAIDNATHGATIEYE
jgi:GMP synthase (glutamine-hydrolysing)